LPARPPTLAVAPDAALARAGEVLAAATRPIAVIGATAMRLADPSLLRSVIEHHNLPCATTTMAKGMLDDDHPLALGCIERACRQLQRKFLRSADLVVGLGYDTVEVEYEAWIGDRPLLQIDIEPVDITPSVKLVHQATGDLDSSLRRLLALPAAANQWNAAMLGEAPPKLSSRIASRGEVLHRPCRDRCGAPRIASRRRTGLRRRRTHAPDRQPMERPRAQDLPDHQRLVVDGLRASRRDRGQAGASRGAGGLSPGRRLFSDDMRRGGDREAPRHHAADRRSSTTAGSRSSR
jgi:hypothetical protein